MQMPPPAHGVSVMNKLIKESQLINSSMECDYINLTTAKDIRDLQKNKFIKYISTLKIMTRAVLRMLFKRYDYVYITVFPYGLAFIKDSIIVLLTRILRLKPILHLHTYGFKKNSERSQWHNKYYRLIFRNVEVICLSDLLIEDIERLFTGNVYILPNGIPRVNKVNTYDNDHIPVTLLFLSNLIRGKGILILLDALKIIKENGHKFCLRVVGSENDITYEQLKKVTIANGLEKEVELLGPKFEEEKYMEFKKAGIFVFPTDYDTFGLVLLEAMQFGIPCISTNIGAIPDVLGDNRGLIIPDIHVDALVTGITELLLNPEKRSEMSQKGFNYYGANFTKEKFEERLKNILTGRPDTINTRLAKKAV